MISTVPITCMACTIAELPLPNLNKTHVSIENWEDDKTFEDNSALISSPIPSPSPSMTSHLVCTRIIFENTRTIFEKPRKKRKYGKDRKKGFNTKKYHVIHQPGRTNCSQRFFG